MAASDIPPRPEAFKGLQPRWWEALYLHYHPLYRLKVPDVAKVMGLKPATVSNYLSQAMLKLGVSKRQDLEKRFWEVLFVAKGDDQVSDLSAFDACGHATCPISGGGSPPCRRSDCPLAA